jgi:hypothetical protein
MKNIPNIGDTLDYENIIISNYVRRHGQLEIVRFGTTYTHAKEVNHGVIYKLLPVGNGVYRLKDNCYFKAYTPEAYAKHLEVCEINSMLKNLPTSVLLEHPGNIDKLLAIVTRLQTLLTNVVAYASVEE